MDASLGLAFKESVVLPLQQGILDKYNIELIGAKLPSIDKAEDRELFKQVGMH